MIRNLPSSFFRLLCLPDSVLFWSWVSQAKLSLHHPLSHWREMVLAQRATTPAAITVCQVAVRGLPLLGRVLAPAATTPVASIAWLRQIAAKQPSIDLVLAQVASIRAVTTACRASDFYWLADRLIETASINLSRSLSEHPCTIGRH